MQLDAQDGSVALLVVGGGPAGSTVARRAAQNGLRVKLLESTPHPRFHIGESFLPRNLTLIRELGLGERLSALPRTAKYGASFAFGNDPEPLDFHFADGLLDADPEAFNIERAPFDGLLLDQAREAGVEVLEGWTVRRILYLADGDVRVAARRDDGSERELRARWLADASGQASIVGRHLATRRRLPDLEKVAYFGHFQNVARADGVRGGYPIIVMCREGWFWMIPLDATRTSIGLVLDAQVAKATGVPPKKMLAWGIARCPFLRQRTDGAIFPEQNGVTADFSYTCRPYAGPGYFLVGDAATFVDPIFSTGVCLGMMSAVLAADGVRDLVAGRRDAARVRREYERYVEGSSAAFFRLVRSYYEHSFRELFLNGAGPLDVHRAVISLLSGHVFPRPPASVRWRMALFDLFVRLQKVLPLVPRRPGFSLLDPGAVAVTRAGDSAA